MRVLLLAALVATTFPAVAADRVALSVAPILGSGAPSGGGWFTYLVRVENTSADPVRGAVRLGTDDALSSEASLSLAPGGAVTIELPQRDLLSRGVRLEAIDDRGERLGRIYVDAPPPAEPLLLDLSVPSRLTPVLAGTHVAIGYQPPTTVPLSAPLLAVTSPFSGSTGELQLPAVAAAYASVTMALAPSDVLAALPDPALAALSDWVLAGGTLAVSVSRPEDLRSAPLSDWIGGKAMRVPPRPELLREQGFLAAAPDPRGPGAPPIVGRLAIAPGEMLAARLDGFSGGNLRPTRWGTAASYGLGEVHLLPWDATSPEVVSDAWVRANLADLMRHAWDRRAHVPMALGSTMQDEYHLRDLLRLLDPNEGARWTVVTSTVLLLIYAVLAGPVIFWRARRRGRPLAVLWQLPLLSVGAMASIVALGLATRGIRGHARHLTLVDAGAGMTRALATRFRAFYSGTSGEITIDSIDSDAVLDLAGADDNPRTLVTTADGPRLERVVLRPWETALVREDSFMAIGGGVSVTSVGDDVRVTNRAARDLLGVVVRVPGAEPRFFARIPDGQSVLAGDGEALASAAFGSSGGPVHPLHAYAMSDALEGVSSGLGRAWTAIDTTVPDVDWWPDDVPVVLAQLDGGEGVSSDSGFRLTTDRVLVRVVGYGGAP